jgi:hypothetical protein
MKPQAEVILPIRINRNSVALDGFGLRGLARLKPGVTVAEANADIARMLPIWLNAWPIPPGTLGRQAIESWRITPAPQPLKDEVVGGVGEMLWVLMGTIGIVLLIACANVANLMLVRFDGRRQEFAVRTALGARRGQIAQGVLIEGLVLALAGGALGVVLAHAGLKVLLATAPDTLPRLGEISLDPRVVAFAVVISFASSLLFAAIPAFKHQSQIGSAARGASASRERQRTRNTLVVIQVALALVLLIRPSRASTLDLPTPPRSRRRGSGSHRNKYRIRSVSPGCSMRFWTRSRLSQVCVRRLSPVRCRWSRTGRH